MLKWADEKNINLNFLVQVVIWVNLFLCIILFKTL